VRGLRARGGFTVDIAWTKGRPTEVVVRSKDGLPLRLRAQGLKHVESDGEEVPFTRSADGVMLLDTKAGATYRFTAG
jgi:alpha-L-fucosidase 2